MISLFTLFWFGAMALGIFVSTRHRLGWFLGLVAGAFGHFGGVLIMWLTVRAVEKRGN